MADLSTTYLGLPLKNPIVASASPLSKKLDKARELEEAGASAVVMYSLFEEQIIHESLELDHYLSRTTDSFAEALSYLPDTGTYSLEPDKYLQRITELKKALTIPVIGSLNGVSRGGWTKYARRIQNAGADVLELNLYFVPVDPAITAQALEADQLELVAEIRSSIKIPLAVKLSPFITALPNYAKGIVAQGAQALVLFNRFYQPDFDIDELEVVHSLDLSTSAEMRLPLRWISILHDKLPTDLALTSGVHTHTDVIKAMMAGAKVVMLASALLHHGPQHITSLLEGMQAWMQEHDYQSIQQMQGSMSQKAVSEPSAFERANYMRVLSSYRDLP
jgi:dihydroorotate dehydrogenase (fumarate)